jgi:hypothetical protein
MHHEEKAPFLIGPATLVNGQAYPATPAKIDRMLKDCGEGNTVRAVLGGSATFTTATLQPQLSFDGGATWVAYGAAISAATPTIIEFPRSCLIRFLVAGTGNITLAALYLG